MAFNRKQVVTMMVLATVAMSAFATVKATCPTLDVCANIPLLNVGFGTQSGTQCCSLIAGLVDAEVELCLCSLLKKSVLGNTLATTLNLPLVGGLIGGLLDPVLSLTYSVLDSEIRVLVNACGLDYAKYKCSVY
ncbi:hypothetical protein RND81_06G228500 [Saponaria officinalis]|uniref:Hydrophobic seed protein domain-containing protein n=1 Tax=Saponaria officinalis TaxID=3572 RepID=A0AAW1KEF4_SAPOF